MYERSGIFCSAVGFLLTAGGVGGIEQSITDDALVSGVLISAVGLMIMACGVLMLKEVDSRA